MRLRTKEYERSETRSTKRTERTDSGPALQSWHSSRSKERASCTMGAKKVRDVRPRAVAAAGRSIICAGAQRVRANCDDTAQSALLRGLHLSSEFTARQYLIANAVLTRVNQKDIDTRALSRKIR